MIIPALLSTAFAAPNILFVVVDDVGVDKVTAYADDVAGYRDAAGHLPETGTMDDLAAAGLRFTTVWANPMCSPTRAGIMTGRHAFRTGVGFPLPVGPELDLATERTLAAVLSDAGYETGLFGKWHLGTTGALGTQNWELGAESAVDINDTAHPLRAGFDAFKGSLNGEVEDYRDWTYVSAEQGAAHLVESSVYTTWQTVEDALDWIDGREAPWFAMVSLNAAHTDGEAGSYEADDADDGCHLVECLADGSCDDMQRASMQALAECGDAGIEELLSGIDPAALADTLIVVVGDNGTEPFVIEGDYATTGQRKTNGKGTVYETGVKVPLLVADGQNYLELRACEDAGQSDCGLTVGMVTSPGRTVVAPVHTVDLFATLGSFGGGDVSTGTDSVDFSPCFTSTSSRCVSSSRTMYTEAYSLTMNGSLASGQAAVKVQGNKLVAKYDAAADCLNYELYILSRDPFERRNMASRSAATLASLKATMSAVGAPWMADIATCQ